MSDESDIPQGSQLWKRIGLSALIAVFGGMLWLLFHKIGTIDYQEILLRVKGYSAGTLAAALGFTALSYVLMSGYDRLGQRFAGRVTGWPRTVLVAFYSYALSLNVGLSLLSSSAIRYRMYQSWGYSPTEIAKIVASASASFWAGLVTLAGLALLASDLSLGLAMPWLEILRVPLGLALTIVGFGYAGLCAWAKGSFELRGRAIPLPSGGMALGQISLTGLDTLAAAAALFVLIPDPSLGFATFLGVYCLAFFGGLASNAPGGLGAFETAFLLLLPTEASTGELLAALVVYRAIYFLIPLLVACGLFAALEGRAVAGKLSPRLAALRFVLDAIAPRALGALIFVGGVSLLVTGSLPSPPARLRWLSEYLPLSLVELSHFAGSVAGMALLFTAYGIRKRLDSAYYLALAALLGSVPLSLLRGDGLLVPALLLGMAGILAPCHRYFYRKSSLLSLRLEFGSLIAIALALASAGYIGFFMYHNGEYARDSWWQFTFDNEKPRFLRATLGAALAGGAFAMIRLFRAPRGEVGQSFAQCREKVETILKENSVAAANLAYMDDKRFLLSADERAFIMFRIQGRSWISMGDPVGAARSFGALIGQFRELCSERNAQPVFYQTSKNHLHAYLDLGLRPLKVGEVARVRLADFSLEGSRRQSMRSRLKRVAKKGCSFEVLEASEALLEMDRLREISDEWLNGKGAREKGFSLGYFDEGYLARFRFGVVRVEGRIVAFANLWEAGNRHELAIDLMRYADEAPPSVMEYLLVELMLWAREAGFEWFDLRMAPLSGIAAGRSAPRWNKLFDLIFQHGEKLYQFRGLRSYKERFDPEWEPMYVASPSGWRLPLIVADLTRAVSAPPRRPSTALVENRLETELEAPSDGDLLSRN